MWLTSSLPLLFPFADALLEQFSSKLKETVKVEKEEKDREIAALIKSSEEKDARIEHLMSELQNEKKRREMIEAQTCAAIQSLQTLVTPSSSPSSFRKRERALSMESCDDEDLSKPLGNILEGLGGDSASSSLSAPVPQKRGPGRPKKVQPAETA